MQINGIFLPKKKYRKQQMEMQHRMKSANVNKISGCISK